MLPVQAQVHFELSESALMPWMVTTDAPGDQGEGSTGTQGCGVSLPIAAAVAAATCGFS